MRANEARDFFKPSELKCSNSLKAHKKREERSSASLRKTSARSGSADLKCDFVEVVQRRTITGKTN